MGKWKHEDKLDAYLVAIETRANVAKWWANVAEWENEVAISEAKACKACKDKMEAHSATLAEPKQMGITTPALVKIMDIDIDELMALVAELESQCVELQASIARLEARNARLRACKECNHQRNKTQSATSAN